MKTYTIIIEPDGITRRTTRTPRELKKAINNTLSKDYRLKTRVNGAEEVFNCCYVEIISIRNFGPLINKRPRLYKVTYISRFHPEEKERICYLRAFSKQRIRDYWRYIMSTDEYKIISIEEA